ncbi:MAG TPA: family 1 glycosylhydrolase, partial [Acidimicrobiales bacterium]|nr:family 1 glycosylhydrolase [Acidimicrobiales bacterium]
DRLVDELLNAGIEPFVTLFHWDLPSALSRLGGWSNPDIAGWFADYATAVAQVLGDRVRFWITLNEPFVVSVEGHLTGNHAPGMRNIYQAIHSVHHQLRAHVAGYHALKAASTAATVGLAMHNTAVWPATDRDDDVAAAERAEAWHNFPLFCEPLVYGRYPPSIGALLQPFLPEGYEEDMKALAVPPDFLGLNYYNSHRVRSSEKSWLGFKSVEDPNVQRTAMGWPVRPEGLRRVLSQANDQYKLPAIYITENGASYKDRLEDGAIHDAERTEFLRAHVAAVLKARDEGAPVKGYFVWSLIDNFEWTYGYSQRFGLVYVDYESQKRTVKDSGHWYGQLARSGSLPPGPH